jgi:hypothetical protein
VGRLGKLAGQLVREDVVRRDAAPVEPLEPVFFGWRQSEDVSM